MHIEFEYDKSKYHLRDVVVGKVYFVLVRIKIKEMQLDLIRTETAGIGKLSTKQHTERNTRLMQNLSNGAHRKSKKRKKKK